MAPGYLCNGLLHNCFVGIGACKSTHIVKVAPGKTTHARESSAKIPSQAVYHFAAPTLLSLPAQNISAYMPVEQYQLTVDGQRRPNLGLLNPLFDLAQELLVAGRYQISLDDGLSASAFPGYPFFGTVL